MRKGNTPSKDELLTLILNNRVEKIEVKKGEDLSTILKKANFAEGTILLIFPTEESTVGNWLEFIKGILNTTWSEIAQILGVKERTIQRWKKGVDFPRANNLKKLKELKEICEFLSKYPDSLKIRFLTTKDLESQKSPSELLREGNTHEVLRKLYLLSEGGAF